MSEMSWRKAYYWRKWNLEYTKRVMQSSPGSQMAAALLACWPIRVQRALTARYGC